MESSSKTKNVLTVGRKFHKMLLPAAQQPSTMAGHRPGLCVSGLNGLAWLSLEIEFIPISYGFIFASNHSILGCRINRFNSTSEERAPLPYR